MPSKAILYSAFVVGALALFTTVVSYGQSSRVISFHDLQKKKIEKKFSWTNPDSSREEMEVTEMPIPVDNEMLDLTSKFMNDNYGSNSTWVDPRIIVIHSMDLEDLRTSLEQSSFLDRKMPKEWATVVKAGSLPSGAHFIIDRDGTIYCLTPPSSITDDRKISYDRNHHQWLIRRHVDAIPIALGIENVTKKDGRYDDLTDEQIVSNAKLVRWLLWMEKSSVKYVMSHHQFNDTTRFESMMKHFSLTTPRPLIRAWTRQDVGDTVLQRILTDVRRRGWLLKDDF